VRVSSFVWVWVCVCVGKYVCGTEKRLRGRCKQRAQKCIHKQKGQNRFIRLSPVDPTMSGHRIRCDICVCLCMCLGVGVREGESEFVCVCVCVCL
jgi:hypothetical protein